MSYLKQGEIYTGKEIIENLKEDKGSFITLLNCTSIENNCKYKIVHDGNVTTSWESSKNELVWHTGYLIEKV